MENKGFSLVELIVVIAIMAILVGVAVPVYTSYIEKTQKASDEQYLSEVVYAAQLFAAENGLVLEKIAIAPEVKADTQQGIELFAKDGDTVYRVEDLSALYDIVGGYTFSTKETNTEVQYYQPAAPEAGTPEGAEHTHDYTVVVRAKTCTQDGVTKCNGCAATQIESATGHTINTETDPYVQVGNLKIYTCKESGCGYQVVIPQGNLIG